MNKESFNNSNQLRDNIRDYINSLNKYQQPQCPLNIIEDLETILNDQAIEESQQLQSKLEQKLYTITQYINKLNYHDPHSHSIKTTIQDIILGQIEYDSQTNQPTTSTDSPSHNVGTAGTLAPTPSMAILPSEILKQIETLLNEPFTPNCLMETIGDAILSYFEDNTGFEKLIESYIRNHLYVNISTQ